MSGHGESTGEIVKSLVVNIVIACAKGVAAAISGSGAMLAETLHSFADCGNQILLLVGVRSAKKPPDAKHPLGYGRSMYFYSFIVALLLFTGGGVFSIYEGVHKMKHPEPVGDVTVGLIILGISILLEGWSCLGNLKAMKAKRGATPLLRYLRESKDIVKSTHYLLEAVNSLLAHDSLSTTTLASPLRASVNRDPRTKRMPMLR